MAVNITASFDEVLQGGAPLLLGNSNMAVVKLVGVATLAADTSNALSLKYLTKNVRVIGGSFIGVVAAGAITFTSLIALGTNTVYVILISDPGPIGGGF